MQRKHAIFSLPTSCDGSYLSCLRGKPIRCILDAVIHHVILHMLSLAFCDDFQIDCLYCTYTLSHAFSTVEKLYDDSIDLIYSNDSLDSSYVVKVTWATNEHVKAKFRYFFEWNVFLLSVLCYILEIKYVTMEWPMCMEVIKSK